MNISYFRKSRHDRPQTLSRLRDAAKDGGFTILGESDLPNGKATIATICKPEWAQAVIDVEPQLLGLLPCTVTVAEKAEATVVGAGTPTLLGSAAPTQALLAMAEQAEAALRLLVETAADVGPLKVQKLILYSTHTCPYCNMEKAWLDKKKLPHEVVFVDEDPKAAETLVRRTGQQGVPQTEVVYEDGSIEFIVGFDKNKLDVVAANF
jgi:glutaredoxin 3